MRCLFVLLLVAASGIAFALPDLQMRNLEYSESTGRLVATIYNGAKDAVNGSTVVYFYDNGNYIGKYVYSEIIPRYSIVSVYINYRPPEGNHSFSAVVNPENTVEERTASNNQKDIGMQSSLNKEPQPVLPTQPEESKKSETESSPIAFIIAAFLTIAFVAAMIIKARKAGMKAGTQTYNTPHEKPPFHANLTNNQFIYPGYILNDMMSSVVWSMDDSISTA